MTKNKQRSKFLCKVLRHRPELIGLQLDEHGWADVEELISKISRRQTFSREILEEIVEQDEKQRYAFNEDRSRIRANQGHSIAVDLNLEPIEPPEFLWHGTGQKYTESIDRTGLKPGSRRYVHLSADRETAREVGKRHGIPVIYRVKTGEMYREGFRFYRSVNGIWLTVFVPADYLEKVEEGEGT